MKIHPNTFLLIFLLILASCAPLTTHTCEKNGVPYCQTQGVFGGKWYDYYERGVSCLEGRCYEAALYDFNEAIRQRSTDKKFIRTYGMHFIDYFPHREKGLLHYETGEYDKAEAEFKISLDTQDSHKARLYLDKTRKRIMELAQQRVSTPELEIQCVSGMVDSSGAVWVRTDPVAIIGAAEDPQLISGISILRKNNDAEDTKLKDVYIGQAGQRIDYEERLALDQGKHVIIASTRNLLGGRKDRELTVHVDRMGPDIVLEDWKAGVSISGAVYDDANKVTLTADGKIVPLIRNRGGWRFKADLPAGSKSIHLTATDELENKTETKVDQDLFSTVSPRWFADGEPRHILTDLESPLKMVQAGVSPVISLKDIGDNEIVFVERMALHGVIKSDVGIERISVNGKTVFGRSGKVVLFNHPLKLKMGENRVVIEASGVDKRISRKTITIVRNIPEVFKRKHRFRLSIDPFEDLCKKSSNQRYVSLIFSQFMSDAMKRNRFQLIAKRSLYSLFPDIGLWVKEAGSKRVWQAMMTGNIDARRQGLEISMEIVHRSSDIIAYVDAYAAYEDDPQLAGLGEILSESLHREFPLIDGRVQKISGEKVQVVPNQGIIKPDSVKMDWPVMIYRKTHPQRRYGSETVILGESYINGAGIEGFGIGAVPDIQTGQGVITQ